MSDKRLNVVLFHPGKAEDYVALLEGEEGLNLTACSDVEALETHLEQADILFTTTRFPVDLLARAKRLKWIQTISAGVERLTLGGSIPNHITLTRITQGFAEKMAEFVLSYLLAITQKIPKILENQKMRRWVQVEMTWLWGRTIGIAGLGVIGSVIAQRAHCFGMRVLAYNRCVNPIPEVERCFGVDQLDEFLKQLHFLVIVLPHTKETEGLFGLRQFEQMRPDAYVVNIARGALIKQDELITALRNKTIAGAVLDVFEQEPLPQSSPLWAMDNVIVSPHHAGPSVPNIIVDFFLQNLERFRQGRPLMGQVDLAQGY